MKNLLLVFVLVFGVSNVYGDDGIADLKEACTNPGAFHNQNPPSEIKISCEDFRTEWVAAGPEEATIHNSRKVCSRAATNKPRVGAPHVCEPCNWPGSEFECGGFKEVESEVAMEFSVTCEQVLAMIAINKFCQDAVLLETRASKEEILTSKATGKTFDTCGNKVYMNGKVTNEVPPMTIGGKPVGPAVKPSNVSQK